MARNLIRTLSSLAVISGACYVAAPASAEVHEVRSDGFIVRHSVTVPADAMATWLALTKPGDWWSDEHTWSGDAANMTLIPQGGGCFCERIPGTDGAAGSQLSGSVEHGTVIQASPLKLLRMRAALGPLQSEPVGGILTFALKESEGGGTTIQLEYHIGGSMRFKPNELAPAIDKVLEEQLTRLRDHLGGGESAATDVEETPTLETEIDALATEE